jgi:hypothetical protein
MSIHRTLATIFCCVLACVLFLPVVRADNWDQMIKATFSQPVEIPGLVLPAGTYWFVLQSSDSERDIVQIFSKDWSTLYATVSTISAERQQSTDETEFKFAERPHNKAEALLKWYYPGQLIGHEFLYSSRHEKEFNRDAKRDVLAKTITLASNAIPRQP